SQEGRADAVDACVPRRFHLTRHSGNVSFYARRAEPRQRFPFERRPHPKLPFRQTVSVKIGMDFATLTKRNLTHFWRTNLAVVLGVATAVAVLAGALLVGDSVRASLRDLALARLGKTDFVITAQGF